MADNDSRDPQRPDGTDQIRGFDDLMGDARLARDRAERVLRHRPFFPERRRPRHWDRSDIEPEDER